MNNKFLASFKIPIFFHSLKGYDGHLIIDKAYLFGVIKHNTNERRNIFISSDR